MNTRVVAIAAVVILLLAGGGLLFYNKTGQQKQARTANSTPSTSPTPNNNSGMTMAQIFASGENKKCTFETKTSSGSTKGSLFVAKANVRGDFTMTSETKVENTHIIRVGDENYIWGDSFPGVKMKLSLSDFASNPQASQAFNANQKTNFNCGGWSPDNSLFVVPSNIKFTDVSTMMEGSMKAGTTGAKVNASACASISDASAKAACEKALMGQ